MDGPGEVTSFKVGIILSFNDKQKYEKVIAAVCKWNSHNEYSHNARRNNLLAWKHGYFVAADYSSTVWLDRVYTLQHLTLSMVYAIPFNIALSH